MADEITVTHDPARSRYVASLGGEPAGEIRYETRADGVLDLTHTEVDSRFEGKGVGSRLAAGTLDAIRADGGKIVATCPFVKKYVERHEEYADLLAG